MSYASNAANAAQVQGDVDAVTIYTYDASAGTPTGACSPTCPPPQEFLTVSMAGARRSRSSRSGSAGCRRIDPFCPPASGRLGDFDSILVPPGNLTAARSRPPNRGRVSPEPRVRCKDPSSGLRMMTFSESPQDWTSAGLGWHGRVDSRSDSEEFRTQAECHLRP